MPKDGNKIYENTYICKNIIGINALVNLWFRLDELPGDIALVYNKNNTIDQNIYYRGTYTEFTQLHTRLNKHALHKYCEETGWDNFGNQDAVKRIKAIISKRIKYFI